MNQFLGIDPMGFLFLQPEMVNWFLDMISLLVFIMLQVLVSLFLDYYCIYDAPGIDESITSSQYLVSFYGATVIGESAPTYKYPVRIYDATSSGEFIPWYHYRIYYSQLYFITLKAQLSSLQFCNLPLSSK